MTPFFRKNNCGLDGSGPAKECLGRRDEKSGFDFELFGLLGHQHLQIQAID
jgi:hypothetical protein